jgi:hypothetical protein
VFFCVLWVGFHSTFKSDPPNGKKITRTTDPGDA